MIHWIKRLFKGKPKSLPEPKSESKSNLEIVNLGILPCCGGTEFYEGPHGGMNVNIKCANPACGQEWNIAAFNGSIIYAEKI
jgi:hypothetical protein